MTAEEFVNEILDRSRVGGCRLEFRLAGMRAGGLVGLIIDERDGANTSEDILIVIIRFEDVLGADRLASISTGWGSGRVGQGVNLVGVRSDGEGVIGGGGDEWEGGMTGGERARGGRIVEERVVGIGSMDGRVWMVVMDGGVLHGTERIAG